MKTYTVGQKTINCGRCNAVIPPEDLVLTATLIAPVMITVSAACACGAKYSHSFAPWLMTPEGGYFTDRHPLYAATVKPIKKKK